MLNALRHQWFGSAIPLSCVPRNGVLNALRHQWFGSLGQNSRSVPSECAQRLAASVVWQSKRGLEGLKCGKCSTPCGISGLAVGGDKNSCLSRYVLNALRHQWFGRNSRHYRISDLGACSTPCGISGLAGLRSRHPGLRCRVLNALRHQWFGSLRPWGFHLVVHTVLNALRHQWFGSAGDQRASGAEIGAQRLAASVVWQSLESVKES